MKIFFDGANLDDLKQAIDWGFIDGVTTNSWFLVREVKSGNYKEHIKKICDMAPDLPVSVYVAGDTAEILAERAREHVKIADNVVIKIPVIMQGIKAIKILKGEGIRTNATCCMTPLQAFLAAKAGAIFISPFVGRIETAYWDAFPQGELYKGMELARQIRQIYDNYKFETEVLVAATRDVRMVLQATLIGADICTAPFTVLKALCDSSLTDSCAKGFADAYDQLPK